MKVTVLGCGSSGGVPLIGNDWGNCDPTEPRNRRRRVSILVEQGGTTLLVDTSPDMRAQLLDAQVNRLDAVLWTHSHADHMNGIDDLRSVNRMMKGPIQVYGDEATLAHARRAFGYVFEPMSTKTTFFYKPLLIPHVIDGPFMVGEIPVTPFVQDHGFAQTMGFRFGSIAYSTDVVRLSDAAFDVLAGVDVWIVDCLREEPAPTHSHLAQTLEWIERVKPRRAILTHMGEKLCYVDLTKRLPPGVEPGYDGLTLDLPDATASG
ncbi:MAG: MBL fold metallo-hydrolase [Elsteraceae bacterium]